MTNVKGGILLRARSGSVFVFPAGMKRAPDSDLRLIVGDEFHFLGGDGHHERRRPVRINRLALFIVVVLAVNERDK